jgi:hypothetical protein
VGRDAVGELGADGAGADAGGAAVVGDADDLETRRPLKDGNHLLMTIGLDVLSLFAH